MTSCSSRWTRALRRGPGLSAPGPHTLPGQSVARRNVGSAAFAGQLHLCGPSGVFRRVFAHSRDARQTSASVCRAFSGQRNHRAGNLRLRRSGHRSRPGGARLPHARASAASASSTSKSPLGQVLPGLFAESHWQEDFGVTEPGSTHNQSPGRAHRRAAVPRKDACFFRERVGDPSAKLLLPARARRRDSLESHAAASAMSIDHLPQAFHAPCGGGPRSSASSAPTTARRTARSGHWGHRLCHPVVSTVPYAEFVLDQDRFMTTLATTASQDSPYQGYAYAYPHKTAYRRFTEPIASARSLGERDA